jgi:hypothetical protein
VRHPKDPDATPWEKGRRRKERRERTEEEGKGKEEERRKRWDHRREMRRKQ